MGDWYPDPDYPGRWLHDDAAPNPGENPAVTMMLPTIQPYPDPGLDVANSNPPAETAGEQDHSNPWFYAGADADPPGAA